jgi:hypothetical protein
MAEGLGSPSQVAAARSPPIIIQKSLASPKSAKKEIKNAREAETVLLMEAARKTFRMVKNTPEDYITMAEMDAFNIVCTSLDLNSGKPRPGDDNETFITPMPMSELNAYLNDIEPWKEADGSICWMILRDDMSKGHPHLEAENTLDIIEAWLNSPKPGPDCYRLMSKLPWENRGWVIFSSVSKISSKVR